MKFTRRETLITFASGFLTLLLPPFVRNVFAKNFLTDDEAITVLREIVNLVIPANAKGGGAVSLGVEKIVWNKAINNRRNKKELLKGLSAFNSESGLRYGGKTFSAITKSEKIKFLQEVSSGNFKSKYISAKSAQKIFSKIRNLTVDHYYSQRSAYRSIGFGGPSQYRGYPDYDQRPKG